MNNMGIKLTDGIPKSFERAISRLPHGAREKARKAYLEEIKGEDGSKVLMKSPANHSAWNPIWKLPISNEPLEIILPGMILKSCNEQLRSNMGNDFRFRKTEKDAAQGALHAAISGGTKIWRFESRVDIWIEQRVANINKSIDPDNLWVKPLVDALTTRAGVIGIIEDDRAKFVRSISKAVENGDPSVIIKICPTSKQRR